MKKRFVRVGALLLALLLCLQLLPTATAVEPTTENSKRAVSQITDMGLDGFVGERLQTNIALWMTQALSDNPNIIEQIRNANSGAVSLNSLISDANQMIGRGIYTLNTTLSHSYRGSALAWTLAATAEGYNDTDFRFASDPSAATDWNGAEELWFYCDGTEFGAAGLGIAFECFDADTKRESWRLTNGATAWLANGGTQWTASEIRDERVQLPEGFRGWVRLPLNNTTFHSYWSEAGTASEQPLLGNVHQLQLNLAGTQAGKTLYLDSFGIVGALAAQQLPCSDGSDRTFREVWSFDHVISGGNYTGAVVPWYDEFPGKLLTGIAYSYRIAPSEELRQAGQTLADALASVQAEDGYLGIYSGAARFGGDGNNWDVWGHYHSIFGLYQWYRVTGDMTAKDTALKAANCVYAHFSGSGRRYSSAGNLTMNLAISHVFSILYSETGEEKFLNAAEEIVQSDWPEAGNWLNDALAGKDYYESSLPRWEALHTLMTLSALYGLTGKETYYNALETIWWSIAKTDRHNTGGFTSGEQAVGDPYATGAIETCCTIAWMALSTDYLQISHDSRVADELELSYLNGMLGSLMEDGAHATYNTPMNGMRKPSQTDISFQYNSGSPDFNCCQANLARGLSEISQWAVLTDRASVYLNYYGASAIKAAAPSGQVLTLTQTTDYPQNGSISVKLGLSAAEAFPLLLRIPAWAEKSRVWVNGIEQTNVTAGTYLSLKRTWNDGDEIHIELDMRPHYWVGESRFVGKAAVYYGPVLLAYDTQRSNLELSEVKLNAAGLNHLTVSAAADGWLDFTVPTAQGTELKLVDFATAGRNGSAYMSWISLESAMDPLTTAKDGKLVWTNQPESTQNIVTWALGDRSIVEAYGNGAMPEFKGSTDRAPDEYIYTFKGWDKEPSAVAGTVTYTALYDREDNPNPPAKTYRVTWLVNGAKTIETYTAGAMPEFKGSTAKPSDTQYSYRFTGWLPELAPVTEDATYTAQYERTEKAASPSDFGWDTDEPKDFSGWYTDDGTSISVDYEKTTGNHRIWKSLPGDEGYYYLTMEAAVEPESSVYLKARGVALELDSRHGNGNEVYLKLNGKDLQWLDAQQGVPVQIVLESVDGVLSLQLTGSSGKTVALTAKESERNENLELGSFAGRATFSNFTVSHEQPIQTNPGDFGWSTDGDDFTGWYAADAVNLQGSYEATTNNHRVWKDLLSDLNDYTVSLRCAVGTNASAYIKVQGVSLELDSRGGNGNQLMLKGEGALNDWFSAEARTVTLYFTRKNGGDVTVTVLGDGSTVSSSYTLTPNDGNRNEVELGLFAGSAAFREIAVTPSREITLPKSPAEYGWSSTEGENYGGWTALSETDFSARYYSTGCHDIYKNILPIDEDFVVDVTVQVDGQSSACLRLHDLTIEVDGRHGGGTKADVKLNQFSLNKEIGWLDAADGVYYIHAVTKDGNIEVTVTGKDNATPFVFLATPAESSGRLGLGLFAGAVSFSQLSLHTHTYTLTENTATCTEPGIATYTCQCGASHTAVTPATGHTEVVDAAVAPTCTTDGKTAGKHCSVCNEVLVKQEVVKATGHKFENGVCTVCGAKDSDYNEPEKPWVNPFKDVKTSDWFYEGVKFANQQELFNGTAHDTFSPNDAMTRAMLVTVLWRLDGKATPTKASGFVDVPSKAYYTEAVAWAAENGIVNGTDATHFAPNDEVTREQIAAILFRYAEKKGVDTTKCADLNAFPDANKVSAYAKDALAWANAEGLVRGSNENGKDYLAPAASATRAQVATILARYAQNIVA